MAEELSLSPLKEITMNIKVKNTIDKYQLIPKGSKVIVALSGGSDSMSLLHVLYLLKDEYDITLEAAHVNHCLRGEDADSDQHFVEEQCKKYGIKLHLLKADVKSIAQKNGESVEEAGRKVRYGFFNSLYDDALIATAHNLSDRVETFFFNFTRGTSLKGLCSIPVKRDNIIRPLIDCTKAEINAYCKKNNIPFVTDKTNTDVVYARNRIRHNVVTELKKINPSFENCASRCIDDINEDEDYLFTLANEKINEAKEEGKYKISVLYNLPKPIVKRAISVIIKENTDFSPDSRMIDDAFSAIRAYEENGEGRKIQIRGDLFMRTRAGCLEFYKENLSKLPNEIVLSEGKNIFGDFEIALEYIAPDTICSHNISKDLASFYIDYDKICGNVVARTRKDGDEISFLSRGITKSLRKIQNENKIPPEMRNIMPVIADDNGLILAWKCGIDKRTCLNSDTKNILKISIYYVGKEDNTNDK